MAYQNAILQVMKDQELCSTAASSAYHSAISTHQLIKHIHDQGNAHNLCLTLTQGQYQIRIACMLYAQRYHGLCSRQEDCIYSAVCQKQ